MFTVMEGEAEIWVKKEEKDFNREIKLNEEIFEI